MTHPAGILKAHGLHAGKKRGQNYLCQPATARAIAASAGIEPGDTVLEIGAGLGALTLPLAGLADRVIALEVDRGIFAALGEVLAEAGASNVEPRLADALRLDWEALAAEVGGPLRIVGNLPYSISSPLLFDLLDHRALWRGATLMLQKELARRLCSGPGGKDWGRLSVLVQMWCQVRPGMEVGPGQFFPRPAVASSVVHLAPRPAPAAELGPEGQASLSRAVKAAFSQRRKTLANSLAGGLSLPREAALSLLATAGVEPTRRAETLSLAEFAALARALAQAGPA
ncbi:MAG: 16S rRNA (adenine(1518)-N(6)/adenine(1519)-N(6))-dimethyltransferase RsmA [Desulfarculaceae bacterium]|nr:16S rRNA (adenine(1518)-N(6)/adenine(1519)-N(6))-dimethyltransferase RsmA [Desulfarculaceae bacterium]MCF8073525.1 16S rRNA (adenine(1518)-N(6)/adenine(1519)-N(6))-dimethyltransferase RsmA [Desulfarculaceae bacterium]MCF8103047.1 16S rRNA (adenine(1518)-N(6)/adenine(1519)-N(6))-dimethyltransferase RsmA [Desulfarculaceae bacterium]MCF8115759.1 16S rRNA (adenine(1518)-N(6)/adenine(1519)-N(6))-dimethyltransferase RsmA [Desulfarculaceae bacterium]